MDLQTISSQMKVVIQKHQIVVTEMRNDPQNPVLQKQLSDLKAEIQTLNERQKQVVEGLRKNLENKQCSPTPCSNNTITFTASSPSPLPLLPNQEIRMFCGTPKYPIQNHKLQTTQRLPLNTPHPDTPCFKQTMVAKPIANCVNAVRHAVPPTLNSLPAPTATFTFKAPVGTVVLPSCPTTAGTLLSSKVAEHQKMHPLLVVPSPSNRTADGQQTGVLLNLGPPIRVPQYPPLSRMSAPPLACQKNPVINNCIPIAVSNVNPVCTPPCIVEPVPPSPEHNSSENTFEMCRSSPVSEKLECKVDQKKLDFLSALGLVSREMLCDIKNKRLERKRRSTANPQFSNAALEEKLRIAAAAQALSAPQKRPRGRPPRSDNRCLAFPSNGTSITDSRLFGPASPTEGSSANCTLSSPSTSHSPLSDCSTLMNGGHRQVTSGEEGKNVEQMLSGLCIVCTQPGDLVKCDTCAKQQHLHCMQPTLTKKPQTPWQCADCQSRTVSLIVVQSFDVMKAAKEDEKRKLLKKSLELRLKRSQLEGRLSQLRELSGKQKSRQSELQASLSGVETLLERVHNVISGVRLCS